MSNFASIPPEQVKAIAEAAINVGIEKAANAFQRAIESISKRKSLAAATRATSYSGYLERTAKHLRMAKTIFFREEPRDLYDFYVPIDLSRGKSIISSPDFRAVAGISPHIVITGSGGSGKSTLLRHLFITSISSEDTIPFYIELRKFKDGADFGLIDELSNVIGYDAGGDSVEAVLATAKFVLFLDGFDELGSQMQQNIGHQINRLARDFPQLRFVVTSRPLAVFVTWSSFTELQTANLTLEKAVLLVRRLGVEKDLEQRFVQALENGLFAKHEYFLSNPLLLLMMLLTYQDFAEIPNKLHLFFEQALFALLHRHDAYKGGLEGALSRALRCKLDTTQYVAVCAAFAIVTHLNGEFRLTDERFRDRLREACDISGYSADVEGLVYDLSVGTCLMLQEGNHYAFSHRLFQEYLVAKFLNTTSLPNRDELIRRACETGEREANVLTMLHGMNQRLAETAVLLPVLPRLQAAAGLRRPLSRTAHVRLLKLCTRSVGILSRVQTGLPTQYRPAFLNPPPGAESAYITLVLLFIAGQYGLPLSAKTISEEQARLFCSRAGIEFPNSISKMESGSYRILHLSIDRLAKNLQALDVIADRLWLSPGFFTRAIEILEKIERRINDSQESAMALLKPQSRLFPRRDDS